MGLRDRLGVQSEGWRPEPGDTLAGQILDIHQRPGYQGAAPYNVYVILDEDSGQCLAWHAMHGVSRQKVEELRPAIGDSMGVRYDGKVKSKGGTDYHSFHVILDRSVENAHLDQLHASVVEANPFDSPFGVRHTPSTNAQAYGE